MMLTSVGFLFLSGMQVFSLGQRLMTVVLLIEAPMVQYTRLFSAK